MQQSRRQSRRTHGARGRDKLSADSSASSATVANDERYVAVEVVGIAGELCTVCADPAERIGHLRTSIATATGIPKTQLEFLDDGDGALDHWSLLGATRRVTAIRTSADQVAQSAMIRAGRLVLRQVNSAK